MSANRLFPWLALAALLAGCGPSASPEPAPGGAEVASPPPEADPPAPRAEPPGPPPPDPPPEPARPPDPAPAPVLERHVLNIALDPAAHRIEGADAIEYSGGPASGVVLALNPTFEVFSVHVGHVAARYTLTGGTLDVRFPAPSDERFTVTVGFRGTLFDPPRRTEMRFVTGEKSEGTIQPEGAYLPASAGWYPDAPGSYARFTVTAKVPEDWEFVGQGGRHDYDPKTRRATWACPLPTPGLVCVAGPYVAAETRAGRVTVRSYFHPKDAAIGDQYRAAAAEWIDHWSASLGPYLFDDFSVVENFFSTGYGMPSYTLLGADVVRMGARYLGEGGLGHEVLHCWWGNGVHLGSGGNWCEALTTYGSNYGWVESAQGEDAARKYRRHQMVRFSVLVDPAKEYPVRQFGGKVTELDNEIGYTKGSMLFHLVRRRAGDRAFWRGLRRVVAERAGRAAEWDDFRAAFEAETGEDYRALWSAWLDKTGVPELRLERTSRGARLAVAGPLADLRVRVRSWRADGPVESDVDVRNGVAEWTEPDDAERLEVDPAFDLFRRIPAEALPRCLNRVVADGARAVVLPDAGETGYEALLQRLGDWEKVPATEAAPERLKGKSVLVLGGADANAVARRWAEAAKLDFGSVKVLAEGWTADGETARPGAHRALLVSGANPDDPARHAAVFAPMNDASKAAARLLLYYGWDSWLVWRDGQVAARGEFPCADVPTLELK
jgi:hypothetical protein